MTQTSVTEKYAQPEVVAFWQEFSQQGLQACEAELLKNHAPPPAKVLDLGCGSGRAELALAPLGYDVTGLDITWDMVQAGQDLTQKANLSANFVQGNMVQLPFETGSYDVVLIFIAALQHVPSQAMRRAALAEINRVLRPGGRLILALDNIAPALTCYAWWGWRKLMSLASPSQSPNKPSNNTPVTSADALLVSKQTRLQAWRWHANGLFRTLRWRTWRGWVDKGRKWGMLPGLAGDTHIQQVSMTTTAGHVYYHMYEHDELLGDAAAAGLESIAYHSGRELTEKQTFAPRVRQLDKQVLYIFRPF